VAPSHVPLQFAGHVPPHPSDVSVERQSAQLEQQHADPQQSQSHACAIAPCVPQESNQ
jgi:hypothetical protein